MSDTVIDSSVVAKWILPEADSAHAQRLIVQELERQRDAIPLLIPLSGEAIYLLFYFLNYLVSKYITAVS